MKKKGTEDHKGGKEGDGGKKRKRARDRRNVRSRMGTRSKELLRVLARLVDTYVNCEYPYYGRLHLRIRFSRVL